MTELKEVRDSPLVGIVEKPLVQQAHLAKMCTKPSDILPTFPLGLGLTIKSVPVSFEHSKAPGKHLSTRQITCNSVQHTEIVHSLLTPVCTPVTPSILFTVGSYNALRLLGSGSFSEVYLAKNSYETESLVALKIVKLSCDGPNRNLISREIDTLKMLNHPNVVAFQDAFETETHFVLVLEYVEDGDLFDYVVNNSNDYCEARVKRIFSQLVEAVEYLHSKCICHRDLKLENILIQQSSNGPISIKITDFGLAEFVGNNSILATRCGSEEYTAPEVILGQPSNGFKADMWSLGVILYAMLVGCLPFSMDGSQSRRNFFYRIANADYRLPQDRPISLEARDILRSMLQSNPKKRLNIDAIKKHSWLSST